MLAAQAKERQRGGQGGVLLRQNSVQTKGKKSEDLAKKQSKTKKQMLLNRPQFGDG